MAPSSEDVVIGYVSQDINIVRYIRDGLKKNGISFWFNDKNTKSATNEKIINCKVFLLVLSDDSAVDESIRDQMALAYISNKAVIPVAIKFFREISKHLSGGMKLMLAKINWIFLAKKEQYESNMSELCDVIKGQLSQSRHVESLTPDPGSSDTSPVTSPPSIQHALRKLNQFSLDLVQNRDEEDALSRRTSISSEFWDRHFENLQEVSWIEFREKFLSDYSERILRHYDEDTQKIFVNLIYKDIFDLYKSISRSTYARFCGENVHADPHLFYRRLEDYVIGYSAMREVFDMQSTVRLTAVANLGSFQTPSVIAMLFELIEDYDPNVRAIAALALAKTGQKLRKIEDQLINMLRDEDRVVRESACLSLAHMRCERSTANIVDLWRNDAIKHVREAAEIALKRMDSEDARAAIHMTEVLVQEMASLRAQKQN